MRILLTGATGFLGRRLLDLLAAHEVFALRRPNPVNTSASSAVEWIDVDLSHPLAVRALPSRMDALIHLAQSHRFSDFPSASPEVFAINVASPLALMNWALTAGVSRAVFASTGTVYEPYDAAMTETAPLHPHSFYGASKLSAEHLTLAYQSEIAVSHLRLFFLYGPAQAGKLISRLIDNIRAGVPVALPLSGEGLRFSPTFVDDAAGVFLQACEEGWRGVWNVAGREVVSLQGISEKIGLLAGRQPVFRRSADIGAAEILPSLEKLGKSVDVARFVGLDRGLKCTIA